MIPVAATLVDANTRVAGSLEIRAGRVARIGRPEHASARRRLAIAGLRNAHVHLDLSLVRGVPRATRGFAAWVLDLLRCRGPFDPSSFQRGAEAGCREVLATGTVAVGDIDSSGAAAAVVAASGLKGIAFREILGSGKDEATLLDLERWLDAFSGFAPAGRVLPGVSPHAAYSTSPGLYRGAARLARARSITLTTHAAETLAEREFLEHGGGEFRELLERVGAPSPRGAGSVSVRPLRLLEELGVLGRSTLLAHVNYPEPDDIDRLAKTQTAVVFCPRSHAFFGHGSHGRHPIDRMVAAGVRVALGTDSRASNGSLDLFGEMAYLRAARPDLPPALLWRAATEIGASLLDGGSGRLTEGEPADLAVVEFPYDVPPTAADCVEALTLGAGKVVATFVDGEIAYAHPDAPAEALPLTEVG
ncbi:MAG: amidohydrolase family protein [Planctomycetes bacterium]|nr:amidohydrolase family protein [Planctomycetota bacterium]MCC7170881.1 amidohydrolase family protein [Planctomycetota bacterium]